MNDTIGTYAAIGAAVGVAVVLLLNRSKREDKK